MNVSESLSSRYWGVVPAAGVGRRMQANCPKQYLRIQGKTILEHTLSRLLACSVFETVVVAISEGDPYWPELLVARESRIITAPGGEQRADSVLSALCLLEGRAAAEDWVLVHDAARPCITPQDIEALVAGLREEPVGGILAVPVHDTLKRVNGQRINETIDRSQIWRAMTPQMFRYGVLKQALQDGEQRGATITDEASAVELQGHQPIIIEGRPDNIKITRPEDLQLAEFYLERI